MKNLSLIIIGLLFVPTLLLTSCDSGDDAVVLEPSFTILKNHMIANNLDIPDIISNTYGEKFVAAAPDALAEVDDFLARYQVIDIRGKADYDASHIPGAKNVELKDILLEGAATTKPILVVCYSGQSACFATSLMRMYGFEHTQALKWGMAGWNSTLSGSWNKHIGSSFGENHPNWSTEAAPANLTFSDPEFASLKTDGDELLKQRVQQTLDYVVLNGFGSIVAAPAGPNNNVLDNPQDFHINNFFNPADYDAFGHIKGAYRIYPLSLENDEYLALDPSAKCVTYCYTGQTSVVITAVLRVLGYDALSLINGMNGMYHTNSAWTSNHWSPEYAKDYPIE